MSIIYLNLKINTEWKKITNYVKHAVTNDQPI